MRKARVRVKRLSMTREELEERTGQAFQSGTSQARAVLGMKIKELEGRIAQEKNSERRLILQTLNNTMQAFAQVVDELSAQLRSMR